jgi:Flp pilus assembly protein TadG
LAETGFVIVLLTFLVMGIVEVGWAFMRTSMIEHSARDGARYGATLNNATGLTYRTAGTGCFTGTGAAQIRTRVRSQLASAGFAPSGPGAPSITVCQDCSGTISVTRVTIVGTLDMLFGLLTSTFPVNRQVTFQDEQRSCPTNVCGCL